MTKQIPDFVFNRQYDNFFLFTEFDIIFSDDFYTKLIFFIKKSGGNKLFFELEDSKENTSLLTRKVEFPNPKEASLHAFYDMTTELDKQTFPIHFINHFIYDDTFEWEIYVSIENELSIFGCNNSIKSLFTAVFEPYKEESLIYKKTIIGGMFNNPETINTFFDALEKNYSFSKQQE